MYAIGAFNGGIGNIGTNLKSFLGQKPQNYSQPLPPPGGIEQEDEETAGDKIGSFVDNISEKFGSSPQRRAPSIENYPLIRSSARVVRGDTLNIQGYYFRLYGKDPLWISGPDKFLNYDYSEKELQRFLNDARDVSVMAKNIFFSLHFSR